MAALLETARKLSKMTRRQRRDVIRRRKDYVLGIVVFRWLAAPLHRWNHFAYLSYLPDAMREYDHPPDFQRLASWWSHQNARRNAGDLPRLLFLIANAHRVLDEGVQGDFAELGVHKGNSAKVLVDALVRADDGRKLFLFDTFDGFDCRDLEGIDSGVPRLYSDTSMQAVRQFVSHDHVCAYRPGYFPASAAEIPSNAQFALVHVDCDLYEPTRAAMAFFYPRLSAGALMVLHDYFERALARSHARGRRVPGRKAGAADTDPGQIRHCSVPQSLVGEVILCRARPVVRAGHEPTTCAAVVAGPQGVLYSGPAQISEATPLGSGGCSM